MHELVSWNTIVSMGWELGSWEMLTNTSTAISTQNCSLGFQSQVAYCKLAINRVSFQCALLSSLS